MARVLVADDSLTIQKVVSITLSSLPYQLVQAKSESELKAQLKTDKFDLLLLDFGLVDKKTGYDLAREIRKGGYQGPILTLVGTFDSIDESNLKDALIDDYITKPFESEKFISKCQNLLSHASQSTADKSSFGFDSVEDLDVKVKVDSDESADQLLKHDDANWVMTASHETSGVREIDLSQLDHDLAATPDVSKTSKNKLQEDLSGWGIGIPDVIGRSEEASNLPPKLPERRPVFHALDPGDDEVEVVAANQSSQNSTDIFHIEDFLTPGPENQSSAQILKISPAKEPAKTSKEDDFKLPGDKDLEYPSFELETKEKPRSKLIPLDQLSATEEEDSEATDPAFELPQGLNEKLLAQFQSDEDPDKFWAADTKASEVKKEEGKPQVFSSANVEIKPEENWEFHTDHLETEVPVQKIVAKPGPNFDEDAIVQKIMNKLVPIFEAKLKDYCKNSVERIAWEVIPDLAENLIREEIKKIEAQSRV